MNNKAIASMGVCLAVGTAFGVAIENIGLGIALGVAVGAALSRVNTNRDG